MLSLVRPIPLINDFLSHNKTVNFRTALQCSDLQTAARFPVRYGGVIEHAHRENHRMKIAVRHLLRSESRRSLGVLYLFYYVPVAR